MEQKIDIEKIIGQCQEWATTNLDENFVFRKYQQEAIVSIIAHVLGDCKVQVMNAPTGSGKSLTAIIAAGVLATYYNKSSYILVSDISLFDQYVKDFERYNLGWGALKGKDNYVCRENGNTLHCAECSLENVSMTTLMDPDNAKKAGFSCATECEYMIERRKAISHPITLMTYQLYLIQRNYIAEQLIGPENEQEAPFPERDFVICDEAHKLNDIVQSHFAPRMNTTKPDWMKNLEEYARKNGLPCPDGNKVITITNKVKKTNDPDKLLQYMVEYLELCSQFSKLNEIIRQDTRKRKHVRQMFKYLSAGNTARDCCCKFSDFIKLAQDFGSAILVKSEGTDEITINCVYEGTMINKYFHEKSNCELLMSATIGGFDTYKKMIGCQMLKDDNWQLLDIPSTFDFTKSPIYYSRNNRMSFKEKSVSGPIICKQIATLCSKFYNVRGIIQTGNYENSELLMQRLPLDIKQRCITYKTPKEKIHALERYEKTPNAILVGPTLLEGLNFDGDKCRFCICMKLPYASLASNLVKAKMELMPEWYNYDLCAKLEQGFGRGVRFNGDWCTTFILDGCIDNVIRYNSNLFCRDTRNRLKALK